MPPEIRKRLLTEGLTLEIIERFLADVTRELPPKINKRLHAAEDY